MPFTVFVMRATNPRDFDERDLVVAAVDMQSLEVAFDEAVKARYKKKPKLVQQFYGNEDEYKEAWNCSTDEVPLYPLPQETGPR